MKKNSQILTILFVLLCFSKINAQVKIGSNPNTIGTNSNLETEANNGVKTVITKDLGNIGVGTTSPNTNALLEMNATNKGLLLTRVALTGTTNAAPLAAHVAGMIVYNTATTSDVTPGLYTNDGAKWNKMVVSTGFIPSIVASASLTSSYSYNDGATGVTCRLGNINANDGNFSSTTYTYTVGSAGTYSLSLTMGYYLSNNANNNSHQIFAVHANSSGTILALVSIASINNFSYTGTQSGNVFMAGNAVFRPAIGDKLYFLSRPCNGCVGSYTITTLEGIIQKISN